MARSVVMDPNTPQRVYLAGPAGIFRSDDGGLTWEAAGEGVVGEPLAVTLDPTSPQRVFVVLVDGTVWHSPDGAATWQKVDVEG